jgi:hypothetical protein
MLARSDVGHGLAVALLPSPRGFGKGIVKLVVEVVEAAEMVQVGCSDQQAAVRIYQSKANTVRKPLVKWVEKANFTI